MPTIEQRGDTYRITVSAGYDLQGKQIRKKMTWKPAPGMTKKQIEKELNRQAVMFEERVQRGQVLDGSIKFADFAEKWFKEHAEPHLKPRTVAGYRALMPRTVQCIGHIPLEKLQPLHLTEFYHELEKDGIAGNARFVASVDIKEIRAKRNMKKVTLRKAAGITDSTLDKVEHGESVARETAEKVCAALSLKLDKAFHRVGNTALSDRRVRCYHAFVSSVLEKAVKWNVIYDNPARRVEPPKQSRIVAPYLDEDGARQLLEALESEDPQHSVMIHLLLLFGMRRAELLGLKWENIDFEKSTISIRQTIHYLPERGIFEDTTKTAGSERTLKAAPYTLQLLRQHQAWQAAERLKVGDLWNDHGYVFTRYNGEPIHPDALSGWFRQFVKRHDLPPIHLHSLRHTSATLLIADHTPLTTVAARLGHANTNTTAKVYAHAIQSADAAAAEALESKLLGSVKKQSSLA